MKTLFLGILTCGLYWVYAGFKWMFTPRKKGLQKISIESAYEVTLGPTDSTEMVDKRRFKKDMVLLKKFMKKFNNKPEFFRYDILQDASQWTIGCSLMDNKEFFALFKERFPRWGLALTIVNVSKKDIDSIARSLKEIKFVYKDRTDRINLYMLNHLILSNPEAVEHALAKHKLTDHSIECGRCGGDIKITDSKGRCSGCGTPLLLRNNKRIKASHTFAEKVAA